MRLILVFVFAVFALPAFAQDERECRGKQRFDLGDGSYGCLLDVGTGSITTTRSRDDGASSSTRSAIQGRVRVLMFGEYNGSKQVTGKRLRQVCQTFLPAVQQELAGKRYDRIILVMIWPRVANPGNYVPKDQSEIAVQPAFSSAQCRGIRYFG